MGKMAAMKGTHKLLDALESIAYGEDKNDMMHCLDVIRGQLAGETTDSPPLTRKRRRRIGKDWPIKSAAHGLLAAASKIAWSKKKEKKQAIMRVAAAYMGQFEEPGSDDHHLECLFVVRAVWGRKRPALELVGPANARPQFLIGYAFWLVAKSEPASVWRKTEHLTQCENKACGRLFKNVRKRGRPRQYCSHKCYTIMHASMDERIKR